MSRLINFISTLQQLTGKKACAASFIFGVCATLALPPVFFTPLAFIGFCGFFWMHGACQYKKQAFWLGWWFGFGHFVSGLYWISFALLIDIAQFGWLIPFAVFGIAAVVAIYPALVSLMLYVLPSSGYRKVILFAFLWTLFEILRGHLFTGFPWNLIGYVWTVSDVMLQSASIVGVWGLSLFSVLLFTMPASLVYQDGKTLKKASIIPTMVVFGIAVAMFAGGTYRLAGAHDKTVQGVYVRIVQPNFTQLFKWDENSRQQIVEQFLQQSTQPSAKPITHLIWPESSLPYYLSESSPVLRLISPAIPKDGAVILGSIHADMTYGGFIEKIWNSLHVINDQGVIYRKYNKHHLVPFGEYVPFRGILPIEKITHGMMDFSAGEGPQTISAPNFPDFSPLICYEVIFPDAVTDGSNAPKVMVNVTNDGWYGNSSGPYQHFHMARTRAVEQGLPLIRAANTGISAMVDAYGRVVNRTTLGEKTVLDAPLPQSLSTKTTYSKLGLILILPMIIIGILLSLKKR